MDANKESQQQILQMTQFILNEAKDKAEEISTKTLQEFSVEKLKVVNQTKEKILADYARKSKLVETQGAIARSTAINRSRLEKIKARQEVITHLSTDSKAELTKQLQSEAKSKTFITKLIVQGALMLLEDDVVVRCRACDDALVQSCLAAASAEYQQVIMQQAKTQKKLTLSLDKAVKLPLAPDASSHESCLGGVVLTCQNGTITIDNTIDARLNLVLEQAKPTIRHLLFAS
jgi:V-type H+-transporting ATPase subunit E